VLQIWLIAHSSGSHGKKVLSRKNMLTIDVAGVWYERSTGNTDLIRSDHPASNCAVFAPLFQPDEQQTIFVNKIPTVYVSLALDEARRGDARDCLVRGYKCTPVCLPPPTARAVHAPDETMDCGLIKVTTLILSYRDTAVALLAYQQGDSQPQDAPSSAAQKHPSRRRCSRAQPAAAASPR